MNLEKETFYKNATNKLLKQLDTMKMSDVERHQAKKLVVLFRNSFKSEEVKRATFNRDIPEFTYYSDGFCKASSFAFINAIIVLLLSLRLLAYKHYFFLHFGHIAF